MALFMALNALLFTNTAAAITPRQVLDKCAATVGTSTGASAHFAMSSVQYGTLSGNISIKGRMFHTKTATTEIWFDGSTLWTYMTNNDEVNISKPTEQQLQTLNPYNFINLYKSGFSYTMTSSNTEYTVHLTATDPAHRIQEAFIVADKNSYAPKEVKMMQDNKWTVFVITDMKSESLSDAVFRFDKSKYPTAEVIDLR